MNENWIPVLLTSPLFTGMDAPGLREMMNCFKPRAASYRRGEILCMEGDEQEGVGVLVSGRIQIVRETMGGNKMVMATLGPGELFGEMAAFSDLHRWPATVVALEASEVVFIAISRFSQNCSHAHGCHDRLIRNMLGILSRKAILLNRKVEYLTLKGMREKLCRYLMEQSHSQGSMTFTMDMNRNELADFLNVSSPSMSRELGRMRDEGLIDFYRGSVRILMPERLVQYGPDAV